MTQDEIISMARDVFGEDEFMPLEDILRFAGMVAAKAAEEEREACARACDQKTDHKEAAKAKKSVADACAEKDQKRELNALRHELTASTFNAGIAACAKAIRARGGNV